MAPSFASYHTATSSGHSSVIATKMATIYAAKGKGATINIYQYVSSAPTSKGKHIQFTCSSVKDKDAEGFGNGTHTGDALVEDAIAAGSLIGSDDSLQLKEF